MKGGLKMNTQRAWHWILGLICMIALSQASLDATATQSAANSFAAQTAQAPTLTPTPTNTPRPTATPVPPTNTPTNTPTATSTPPPKNTPTRTPIPLPTRTKGPTVTPVPKTPPLLTVVRQTMDHVNSFKGALFQGGESCADFFRQFNGIVNAPTFDMTSQSSTVQGAYGLYRQAVTTAGSKATVFNDICSSGGGF